LEQGGNIERQIKLVRGGPARVEIALVARWRARTQRGRWADSDVSVVTELDAFDERLKRAWTEQYGPMCDDCAGLPENERCSHGLGVLNWALLHAAAEIVPPRPEWRHPFYAQGMLQQFADKLEVGWHPNFEERLRSAEEETPDQVPNALPTPDRPSRRRSRATNPK
jgi:hypothetical protein